MSTEANQCPTCKSQDIRTLKATERNQYYNCNNCHVGYWLPLHEALKPTQVNPRLFCEEVSMADRINAPLTCDECGSPSMYIASVLMERQSVILKCVDCGHAQEDSLDEVLS